MPEIEEVMPQFPASIPRAAPAEPEAPPLHEMDEPIMDEPEKPENRVSRRRRPVRWRADW